ncbi:MAG: nitroreductase [Jatrophihabitans sp.]|nr:MAG: nitroreductase [Jatrophihabitans sp.]
MTIVAATSAAVALRRAADRAILAPSVHNTQPWRLHLSRDRLAVLADGTRRLRVLDPAGRQLLISCGCAVLNARASLAASGFGVVVDRSADPAQDEVLASMTLSGRPPDGALAGLDPVIETRHTNRRQFCGDPVPEAVLAALQHAADTEGASLLVVRDDQQRAAVAALSRHADDIENLDPAYRAELRAWTTSDPSRRDGVPDLAVPRTDGAVRDDVPIRDFDAHGTGGLPAATHPSRGETLALLCTRGDSPADWLRAGEALERVLLEITRYGYAASPLTQVTEVPATRALLRDELHLPGFPHLLLRIGRAPDAPAARRRRLADVLVDER